MARRTSVQEYLKAINLLKNSGLSLKQIAAEVGVDYDVVSNINKGHQMIVHDLYNGTYPINGKPLSVKSEDILMDFLDGMTITELRYKYDKSTYQIKYALKINGIDLNKK